MPSLGNLTLAMFLADELKRDVECSAGADATLVQDFVIIEIGLR